MAGYALRIWVRGLGVRALIRPFAMDVLAALANSQNHGKAFRHRVGIGQVRTTQGSTSCQPSVGKSFPEKIIPTACSARRIPLGHAGTPAKEQDDIQPHAHRDSSHEGTGDKEAYANELRAVQTHGIKTSPSPKYFLKRNILEGSVSLAVVSTGTGGVKFKTR